MRQFYNIIRRPIVTEKTSDLNEFENKVVFEVDKKANKIEIAKAVEKLFNVRVLKVNTLIMPGKVKNVGRVRGRTSSFKKAFVTLREGDSIDFYEGV